MTKKSIRIGTRGSDLALWQARYVKRMLEEAHPGTAVAVQVITTSGDRIQDRSLLEMGGKGLFVKEIQLALLRGEVDFAIHSLKDYPVDNPEELVLACVPPREDPRDALVLPPGRRAEDLGSKARIGTGSLRRAHQVSRLYPSCRVSGLRGNVGTRLGKVDSGEVDATILAVAGLKRLGHGDRITRAFGVDEMVPAVGQGALAVEARRDDGETLAMVEVMQDDEARIRVEAERRFLLGIGGSCTTPVGIHATIEGSTLLLRAFLASPEGGRILKEGTEGPVGRPGEVVDRLLASLEKQGAREILETEG